MKKTTIENNTMQKSKNIGDKVVNINKKRQFYSDENSMIIIQRKHILDKKIIEIRFGGDVKAEFSTKSPTRLDRVFYALLDESVEKLNEWGLREITN